MKNRDDVERDLADTTGNSANKNENSANTTGNLAEDFDTHQTSSNI
jgi:hypothetical protein